MTEKWKAIPGYEGRFEASTEGRIRSVDYVAQRGDGRTRTIRGQVLKPIVRPDGRLVVTLPGRPRKKARVHRLVLMTFDRMPEPGEEACHFPDPDPSNNWLSNLRWGTSSANKLDSVEQGIHPQARKTRCPQGHEYTPDNIYRSGNRRSCRACNLGHDK